MDEKTMLERMREELEKRQHSLETSLQELHTEKKILDVLSIDYTSIYYCDLLADTMIAVKQGTNTNAAVTDQKITDGHQSYSFRIRYYYEHFVIPESAPDFVYRLSAGYLMKYLTENERFAYRFRTQPNPAGKQYFEVQIARLAEEGFKVVMGYRYVDDLVAEQERQKTQLENALAEARLNSEIVNSISKLYWLIYRVDLIEGTYEEVSAHTETLCLTGKSGRIEDVVREMCKSIVSKEYLPMMAAFWDISTLPKRLQDAESVAAEYRAASGAWNLARFIVKKRDENGQVTNVLYAVRQIDQEKQKELEYKQKLLDAAEDAQRANLAKTDFLRRMSHDIRTPINGILGMISIADHYADDPQKLKECRGKVREAAGFLLDLVNGILDMNKLESGIVELEHKPFDLRQVLQDSDNIAAMNGESQDLVMNFDNEQIRHVHLFGSPLHLEQILQNLAGNAIKYNKAGGKVFCSCKEISYEETPKSPDKARTARAVYQFVCADTGRGMSKEFLSHAFEPFAQENTDARTAYMGTGLGLPIAKQLVEMMGGTIQVESTINVGTTFTATIPFEVNLNYREEKAAEVSISDEVLQGKRVLLAEDNELNSEIARFLLEKNGMAVTVAANGKEAVECFSMSLPNYFDVVLMDIMMPVMNGLTAAKTIRGLSRPDAQTVPIFAMTANAFKEDIEQSKAAGMNEHLSKPIDETLLKMLLKQYLVML